MDSYLILKPLHILSAIVFLGGLISGQVVRVSGAAAGYTS